MADVTRLQEYGVLLIYSSSVIIRSTLIYTLTPNYIKGRLASVNNILFGPWNETGAFESGFTAKLMGVVPAVAFGGTMTLLVVAVTFFKADKQRTLDLAPAMEAG